MCSLPSGWAFHSEKPPYVRTQGSNRCTQYWVPGSRHNIDRSVPQRKSAEGAILALRKRVEALTYQTEAQCALATAAHGHARADIDIYIIYGKRKVNSCEPSMKYVSQRSTHLCIHSTVWIPGRPSSARQSAIIFQPPGCESRIRSAASRSSAKQQRDHGR